MKCVSGRRVRGAVRPTSAGPDVPLEWLQLVAKERGNLGLVFLQAREQYSAMEMHAKITNK